MMTSGQYRPAVLKMNARREKSDDLYVVGNFYPSPRRRCDFKWLFGLK
jgi:hypothetical protein